MSPPSPRGRTGMQLRENGDVVAQNGNVAAHDGDIAALKNGDVSPFKDLYLPDDIEYRRTGRGDCSPLA